MGLINVSFRVSEKGNGLFSCLLPRSKIVLLSLKQVVLGASPAQRFKLSLSLKGYLDGMWVDLLHLESVQENFQISPVKLIWLHKCQRWAQLCRDYLCF